MDVIYIEDEDISAQIFTLGLSAYDIHVLHLPDTQPETLALLDTPPYQEAKCIFFDLWIGAVNGVDLARSFREKGDQRPFFLITAGEHPNLALLRELRLTFVQKPVRDFRKLTDTIRSA